LRALEEEGIVERHTFPEVPPRVEYALTEKGRALLPIVEDMRNYGERWLTRGSEESVRIALASKVGAAA
jgi:DNA-binding HxlR family transcriptional regulator